MESSAGCAMSCLRNAMVWTVLALLSVACASTTPPPPATWDGLERHSTTGSGALYVRPGVPARIYRSVVIDPLVVSTDPDWLPNRRIQTRAIAGQHPVSAREVEYIERTIDPAYRDMIARELAAAGYQVVDRPRDDTLRVSPGLANVFIDSPAAGMGRLRNDDAMTLVVNVTDPASGQLWARLIDTRKGKMGMLESPNTVANNAAFRRAVRDWANLLVDTLEIVNVSPASPSGAQVVVERRPE